MKFDFVFNFCIQIFDFIYKDVHIQCDATLKAMLPEIKVLS